MNKKYFSGEELCLQVCDEVCPQSNSRTGQGSSLSSHSGRESHSIPASIPILRPEIEESPLWEQSLASVSMFALPATTLCTSSLPRSGVRQQRVRYVADHFDRLWLKKKAELGRDGHGRRSTGTGSSGDTTLDELEEIIALLDVESHKRFGTPPEHIVLDEGVLSRRGLIPHKVPEIKQYWVRKREALGGQVPCIAALRIMPAAKEETAICRGDILGDCPMPFRRREWISLVFLRRGVEESAVQRKKRSREETWKWSEAALCEKALELSTHMFIREQLQMHHTYLSLYELSYLRRISDNCHRNFGSNTIEESVSGTDYKVDVKRLLCIPQVSQGKE